MCLKSLKAQKFGSSLVSNEGPGKQVVPHGHTLENGWPPRSTLCSSEQLFVNSTPNSSFTEIACSPRSCLMPVFAYQPSSLPSPSLLIHRMRRPALCEQTCSQKKLLQGQNQRIWPLDAYLFLSPE